MNAKKMMALLMSLALVLLACGADTTAEEPVPAPAPDDTAGEPAPPTGETCAAGETDGNLNFYNWSEYIDPDLLSAFEAEYGVSVVESFYDSNEAMLAQLQAGVVYDLIVPSDYMVGIMIQEGLLLPLQKDAVPNIANLAGQFQAPPYDPGLEYSVAYQYGTTGLGVNLDVVGDDVEPTWALVFDPELASRYSGQISLLNDPRETMGAALMYLGHSINDVDLANLQEATELLAEARQHVATFDSDQYASSLVTGETAVAHGYSGGMITAISDADDPDRFDYLLPAEGATLWVDNMAIPVGAEHPCTAHAFIDFILDAENGATLTNWNWYGSPNAASMEFIEEEVAEFYAETDVAPNLQVIEDTGDYEINFTDFFAQARS